MSDTSLGPWLNVEVPDLNTLAWKQTVRLAWVRSREIVQQRHDIWDLRNFEYRHFFSGWAGLAFRFHSCTEHDKVFSASFRQSGGDSSDEALYKEDEALFGFFVEGLSALDCFCYGLYALGALVRTPTHIPSNPPLSLFPLLDPHNSRKPQEIKPLVTLHAFQQHFAGHALTTQIAQILDDPEYREWKYIRNVLAHRAATAGRSFQYTDSSALLGDDNSLPSAITLWAGEIRLTPDTTLSRYRWLRETINSGIGAALAFTQQELPYNEARLPPL